MPCITTTPEKGPPTILAAVSDNVKHPILTGVANEFQSKAHLYKNKTIAKTATPLLRGKIGQNGKENEFVAWTNIHKGGRVFYTSLGYIEDFQELSFRRLLLNGMFWAMEKPVPKK